MVTHKAISFSLLQNIVVVDILNSVVGCFFANKHEVDNCLVILSRKTYFSNIKAKNSTSSSLVLDHQVFAC